MSESQLIPDGAGTDDKIARERSMREVSDVLLCVEHALDRARRAHKNVTKAGVDSNAELALGEATASLDRLRKRLFQDTYMAAGKLRLM